MQNPAKYHESFTQTIVRTIVTTTLIAVILYFLHLFPGHELSQVSKFEMIWLAVFCIVFGGHWLELLFINYIKFKLPKNILLLYLTRIVYWYLCAIPLFFSAGIVVELFLHNSTFRAHLKPIGFFYIGIQLVMHAIMQARIKKSFYNGVY